MLQRTHLLLIFSCLAAMLALATPPQAAPVRRVRLFLKSPGSFDPVSERPQVENDLTAEAAERESPPPFGAAVRGKVAGKLGHWIVQFDGPVREEWKAPIADIGGLVLDYVPDYGFVVRIPAQQVPALRSLAHVRSVQRYHPAFAVSSRFPKKSVTVPITIATFTTMDVPGVTARIKQQRGLVVNSAVIEGHGLIEAQVRATALRPLARAFGVCWIEYRDRAQLHNDQSVTIGNVDDVRTNVGLYGANQVVAVYDTGLDTGNPATIHSDFTGRIAATHLYGNQGDWSDLQSHGTHVMGTVLGSGVSSGADLSSHNYPVTGTPCYAGIAPEAQLVVQSNLNLDGSLGGADAITFQKVLKDAYDDGARVHSDSWGAFTDGSYNYQCWGVDTFAHQSKDMVICFSAGNSGVDQSPQDGVVDAGSHRAPAVSKNVIAVGASETNRPTVNWAWGSGYGSPISSDLIGDNPNGMCAFSSRGPCDDTAGTGGIKRIKPDLVAPGSLVASTRTSMSFLTEGFESTTVGSVPTGWSTNVPSVVKVTSADSYSGGRSLGFGNSSANSGYSGYTGTGAVWSGAITTARANSALAVSFRTRYNIQPGDTAIVGRLSSGGSILSSQSSGVSGSSGGWVHKTVFIPNVNDATYGDLRVQPIIFGLNVASNPSSGAGYYWEIDDVRVVPILSSTLGLWGTETAGSARDEAYQYSNGTSMACPAVAGMAALVREYYQERKNFPNPSSALVKATLITSAASMGSGQYGTGSTQEIPPARPNSVNGWGRADLQKAVAPSTTSYPNTRQLFADVSTGLKTGGVDTYTVNVSAGTPLNVGLVWTDPAATVAASVTLVNNLDLAVDPDGVGTGVAASPGNGVAGDDRNTVETVDFTAPSSGTYTITVTGTNVPTGQQPYALVIYGDVSWQDTLIVSPATTTCELGGKTPFTAMVNGRPTTAATWSVVSGGGNISTSGLYTAPGSGTTATVRATYGSLTKDATITFVTATSQATAYIVVYTGDITRLTGITVGVGPNPDSPIASSQFSYALSGSPGIWTLWFNVDALVPYLPPDSSTPWWARIHTNGSSVGTMIDFYVLRGTRDGTGYVTSGQRFSSTNLPIDLAATTGPPYGWIDTAAPTVSLTTPASDATVSGSVNFSADATDNDRIARVDFLVDDRLIGTDTTASGNSYSVTWDTTAETNIRHRLTVRAADKSGNIAEDFHLVTTNNAGSRPNVALTMGSWSFNSTTRDLTATASFTNTGSADAYKVTLQRLTLYATGSTFSGFRQVYMEPSSGSPFPRNVGTVTTGTSTTLTLHAILPPEVTAIPRWAGAGTYYDASSGGSKYNL